MIMPIRLAIVEDLDEVREGLRNYLKRTDDFELLGDYQTAEEAIPVILSSLPDIVIMDIHLPGMNGIECIRKLRPDCPETQYMMFTVYENDDKVFEALQAGASGYLLKHTPLPQLAEALKELHAGGSPMSVHVARKLVKVFQSPPKSHPEVDLLSEREYEVLQLLSNGLLYKEISDQLSISIHTVRQHIHKIYEKLHVQNRTEALNKVFTRPI